MKTDKKRRNNLQPYAQGFEAFAATGWLGMETRAAPNPESSTTQQSARDKSKTSGKKKRKTTIRIA